MDAMGARRRAKNLPAISLQWGPWADVGMAARAGTSEGAPKASQALDTPSRPLHQKKLEAVVGSMARLDPERGLEAMALVLGSSLRPSGQVAEMNGECTVVVQFDMRK